MKLSKEFNYTNLFVYLYLAIFIFLLCYTFYRAEFIHSGSQLTYYYKYYLIFIFSVIFWFIVLFLKKEKKIQIVTQVTILIFLLYCYETVRFFGPTIFKSIPSKTQSNEKTKQEVIQDLKMNQGEDVVPSIFPKALLDKQWINEETDIFPLGGVSNTTTVFCKEGEKYSIYKSDRYGFNNPDHEWNYEKIPWFLVGDSFTQGACVQPGEDLASQIRLLTQRSAISVGMSGNGPLIEFASLKEYGIKKKPEIVLWLYVERNDLSDLKNEKSNSVIIKYLNEGFSQNLYNKQTTIDKKLKQFIKVAEEELTKEKLRANQDLDKFLSFKKILRLQIIRDKTSLDRGLNFGIDPLFKKIILMANDLVNTWNGKLYFVYLPDKERYREGMNKDDSYLQRSEVIEIINDLNIPIIDIHNEFFKKQNDPISFFAHRIYGHYSPQGYSEISKVIIDKINNKSN